MEGFSWISSDDKDNSVIAFRRMDESGKEIIAVCNFTNVERLDYRIGVPKKGNYKVFFNSDDVAYGGEGRGNKDKIKAETINMHGFEQSILGLAAAFDNLFKENPLKSGFKALLS